MYFLVLTVVSSFCGGMWFTHLGTLFTVAYSNAVLTSE